MREAHDPTTTPANPPHPIPKKINNAPQRPLSVKPPRSLPRPHERDARALHLVAPRELGEEVRIEVDPERVRKVERQHLLADVTKLKRFAQWEPKVSLDEGIRTLLREGA